MIEQVFFTISKVRQSCSRIFVYLSRQHFYAAFVAFNDKIYIHCGDTGELQLTDSVHGVHAFY